MMFLFQKALKAAASGPTSIQRWSGPSDQRQRDCLFCQKTHIGYWQSPSIFVQPASQARCDHLPRKGASPNTCILSRDRRLRVRIEPSETSSPPILLGFFPSSHPPFRRGGFLPRQAYAYSQPSAVTSWCIRFGAADGTFWFQPSRTSAISDTNDEASSDSYTGGRDSGDTNWDDGVPQSPTSTPNVFILWTASGHASILHTFRCPKND
uniref:Uncharacterized protein n=1 Tax=Panagrellus redivivus TaxID=6233 RepID=A0A7E4VRA7_PANRE